MQSQQQPSGPSRQPSTTTPAAKADTPPLAAIRNLNPPEYAVADTPGTSDPFGSGTDYLNYRPAPKCEHIPDDGTTPSPPPPPPSSLSRSGIRGGLPSNAQKESEAHAAGGGHVLHRHPLRQSENVDDEQGETGGGSGSWSGSGVPLRHGRVRGEVTLDEDEAEMERKKAQHSLARVQLKEELRKGEGVREGRRPGAEPRV
ncbi:hypothetical protein B0T19DRAFT_420315 [Cercophora scortea]|uniref:Uncharacterized protein n=1 Tax=Cercophora scortea TaxID=314031 RepID=A0AAE0MJQ9_9PEZI|nr:hypothetical protein B0T19DRAFT_420315 [Cercophora scortea]